MNIRRWHKQKSRLQALPKSKMAERGHVAAYPELEKQLLEWISERRQEGGGVSISEVRVKALTLVKAMPNNVVGFKASYGCGSRLCSGVTFLYDDEQQSCRNCQLTSTPSFSSFSSTS